MRDILLKNNVYLFLLAFYNNQTMVNFVELAKVIGISRQTVSNKVKKLLSDKFIKINDDNILFVENSLDLDVDLLRKILEKTPDISAAQLEDIFFNNKDNKEVLVNIEDDFLGEDRVVYGIISEGVIKYIGSTKEYEERIKQHIRKRTFLTSNNFIVLKYVKAQDRFNYEKQLIKILQPE